MSTPKLRARGQILPMVAVTLFVLATLASAAVTMIPAHRPSAAELRAEDQRDVVAERRDRIAELVLGADRCEPPQAHELARLLVLDGRFAEARAYAEHYEARCGEDPVVHGWGQAPAPKLHRE